MLIVPAALALAVTPANEHKISYETDIQPPYSAVQSVQVQPPVSRNLEGLESFLTFVSDELSKDVVPRREFYEDSFDQLTLQGILSGEFGDIGNPGRVGLYVGKAFQRLGAGFIDGLYNGYFIMPGTTISPDRQKDIDAHRLLDQGLMTYLRREIGDDPVEAQTFESLVETYVLPRLPATLPEKRRTLLLDYFERFYSLKFKIFEMGYNKTSKLL